MTLLDHQLVLKCSDIMLRCQLQYDTTGPSACMHVGHFLVALTCVLVTPLHNSRQASCNGALWWLGSLKDTAVHCVFPSVGTLLSMSFTLSTYMIQDNGKESRSIYSLSPRTQTNLGMDCFQYCACYTGSDICTELGLRKIHNCMPCWQFQISCPVCNTESNPSRGCFGLGARLRQSSTSLVTYSQVFLDPTRPLPHKCKVTQLRVSTRLCMTSPIVPQNLQQP